ncbi:neuronal acetylcholine receptor subunit alpha-7-like [Mercenaria mercenaria]|uniref:neuronal acetylcholine receptor subunit alpha-7-like n=1 Tax=Mercenaria mercenaria TaxID=6596 RepID=UPI00234F4635|nr:neuronal acetylcholine receptor subunit alpha-7-like [Mercenaria mercenaria]
MYNNKKRRKYHKLDLCFHFYSLYTNGFFLKMQITVVLLVVSTLMDVAKCSTLNDSKQLVSDLLETYDRRQRPVLNQSQPVVVLCEYILKGIQGFSEVDGMLKVRGTLYMEWIDQSLIWDVKTYGNIRSFSFPVSDVWYPKIVLLNSFDEPNPVGKDWMNIRVSHDGKAKLFGMEVFKISCDADVTFFPFDTQTCSMFFIAFGNTFNEVKLFSDTSASDDPLIKQTLKNKEWSLQNFTTRRVHQPMQRDLIVTTFVMKRLPAFLILNIFLPVLCLALINVLVFLLPPESGERISFAVTVLLSMAVYMTIIENNLPKISKPMPWICYYLAAVLIQSGLICITAIFNLYLYHKENNKTIPLCFQTTANGCISAGKSQKPLEETSDDMMLKTDEEHVNENSSNVTWQDISFAVDKISFIYFLLAIITCNILYFTITLSKAEKQGNTVINELFG